MVKFQQSLSHNNCYNLKYVAKNLFIPFQLNFKEMKFFLWKPIINYP